MAVSSADTSWPKHPNPAGGGRDQAQHAPDGGGLPGPVGPEVPEGLSGPHRERHAVHGEGAAVPLDQALDLDHGVHARQAYPSGADASEDRRRIGHARVNG